MLSRYSLIIFKLGMIRFATSLLVVLITNVLTRVLMSNFGYSTTVIVFIFAFQHLATPSGLLAGYFSDKIDSIRRRRTPFILGGMLLCLAIMPFFPMWGVGICLSTSERVLALVGYKSLFSVWHRDHGIRYGD